MEEKMKKNKRKQVFIDCIGSDGKRHVCRPDEKVCKCGIKVVSKQIGIKDYIRYWCYECAD
jgi:hypothetical protein